MLGDLTKFGSEGDAAETDGEERKDLRAGECEVSSSGEDSTMSMRGTMRADAGGAGETACGSGWSRRSPASTSARFPLRSSLTVRFDCLLCRASFLFVFFAALFAGTAFLSFLPLAVFPATDLSTLPLLLYDLELLYEGGLDPPFPGLSPFTAGIGRRTDCRGKGDRSGK